MSGLRRRSFLIAWIVVATSSPSAAGANWLLDLWLTPDQQAQQAFDAGAFAEAATRFSDPMRIGAAWYRAGEFERAARAFGRSDTPEAHFNRGNALVIQGAYDDAIVAYDQALARRPDWPEARENRALAALRKARLTPAGDDAGGTGGQLAADDFVIDGAPARPPGTAEDTELTEGMDGALTDDRLRELWLRRVQTRPADFLAARFELQLQLRDAEASAP